jgi:hypothetical protein
VCVCPKPVLAKHPVSEAENCGNADLLRTVRIRATPADPQAALPKCPRPHPAQFSPADGFPPSKSNRFSHVPKSLACLVNIHPYLVLATLRVSKLPRKAFEQNFFVFSISFLRNALYRVVCHDSTVHAFLAVCEHVRREERRRCAGRPCCLPHLDIVHTCKSTLCIQHFCFVVVLSLSGQQNRCVSFSLKTPGI